MKKTHSLFVLLALGSLVLAGCSFDGIGELPDLEDSYSQESTPESKQEEEEGEWNPITAEIQAKANAYDYSFDPESITIEKQDTYDFNAAALTAVDKGASTREGKHLVYLFEGSYAEGYNGDYTPVFANLYLWEDGIFTGKSNETSFRGYWYNKKGDTDCLEMVSNESKYESIVCQETTGFYTQAAYVYLSFSWGQRSIIVCGYYYYPEVALFIDANTEGKAVNYKVGDTFDRSMWTANRVLKNLQYYPVFNSREITWTDPTGFKNGKEITAAGDYTVTASWNGLTAEMPIHVSE